MSDNVSILHTSGEPRRNPGMEFERVKCVHPCRIFSLPLAMGNRVAAIPSARHPLSATDLYQELDTSELPGGALNIVTGARDELAPALAEHDDVDAIWYFGSAAGGAAVERASAGNLKRDWSDHGRRRDWFADRQAEGREVLRHAVNVKNIWAPYGE